VETQHPNFLSRRRCACVSRGLGEGDEKNVIPGMWRIKPGRKNRVLMLDYHCSIAFAGLHPNLNICHL
jgi:hypothetical protein